MTFNQYRIIIDVFQSFGISIAGQRKYKNFFLDFQVNQLYVKAILFELELQLGIYLEEEAIEGFCCPQSIVSALCKHNKSGRMDSRLLIPSGIHSREQKSAPV